MCRRLQDSMSSADGMNLNRMSPCASHVSSALNTLYMPIFRPGAGQSRPCRNMASVRITACAGSFLHGVSYMRQI